LKPGAVRQAPLRFLASVFLLARIRPDDDENKKEKRNERFKRENKHWVLVE